MTRRTGLSRANRWVQKRLEYKFRASHPRRDEKSEREPHTRAFTPDDKSRLWDKQNGRCAYCNAPFANYADATIDHLIPLSRGGLAAYSNKRLCCRPCNQAKSNLLPGDPEWDRKGTPIAHPTVTTYRCKFPHAIVPRDAHGRKVLGVLAWDNEGDDPDIVPQNADGSYSLSKKFYRFVVE